MTDGRDADGRAPADLRQWVGWYAVSRNGRLLGLFQTYAAAAGALAELLDDTSAEIRRVEPAAAVGPAVTVRCGWAMGTGSPAVGWA